MWARTIASKLSSAWKPRARERFASKAVGQPDDLLDRGFARGG
jgi:hypothetical protein